ncbi:hypothetical protein [uncultured Ruminococcus sp.]|uniref:hypothetical protein n=1 Tax=uncultured Ruminococcus sp. TaxID=165186 RepID=UPI0025CD257F|nr:hypothetical protein [uncultured Ruminococcus sp.]
MSYLKYVIIILAQKAKTVIYNKCTDGNGVKNPRMGNSETAVRPNDCGRGTTQAKQRACR